MRSHLAFLLLVAGQACTVDRTASRNLVAVDGIEPEEPGFSQSHTVCGLDPETCATRVSGGVSLLFGGSVAVLLVDQRAMSDGESWSGTPPPGATYGGPFTTVTFDASSLDEGAVASFEAVAMLYVSLQEFQPIPFTEGTLDVVSVGEARDLDAGFSDVRLCWNLTFGEVSPDTTYAKYHGCQTFP